MGQDLFGCHTKKEIEEYVRTLTPVPQDQDVIRRNITHGHKAVLLEKRLSSRGISAVLAFSPKQLGMISYEDLEKFASMLRSPQYAWMLSLAKAKGTWMQKCQEILEGKVFFQISHRKGTHTYTEEATDEASTPESLSGEVNTRVLAVSPGDWLSERPGTANFNTEADMRLTESNSFVAVRGNNPSLYGGCMRWPTNWPETVNNVLVVKELSKLSSVDEEVDARILDVAMFIGKEEGQFVSPLEMACHGTKGRLALPIAWCLEK